MKPYKWHQGQQTTLWLSPLTYISKTLTFAITFEPIETGLLYFKCAFLVMGPFYLY